MTRTVDHAAWLNGEKEGKAQMDGKVQSGVGGLVNQ
jgi:hypothetical protein